jgi:hypothetical protein
MLRVLGTLMLACTLIFATPTFPVQTRSLVSAQGQGNPNAKVWVNTKSGVYHCPGTRWYGNTKEGKYMTQKEAQAAGYRPAYGAVCG